MGSSHIFRETFIEKYFSKTIWKELLTKEKDKEILYEFEEAKGTKASKGRYSGMQEGSNK